MVKITERKRAGAAKIHFGRVEDTFLTLTPEVKSVIGSA